MSQTLTILPATIPARATSLLATSHFRWRSLLLPVNTYEGMFLLDSAKAATAWDDTVKHVHDILTKHHSEIVASRQWDERRLAYSIGGHKKGTYLLTYFRTDGENLKEIVADCRLERRHPARARAQGAPQAGGPPGQPGDDVDAERRRGERHRDDELDERPRRRRRDD